jgi:hypothetical protein
MKIKNRTFAIPAAPEAMPPKPNTPAIIATIKKITVHRSIFLLFRVNNSLPFSCIKKYANKDF